MIPTTRVDEPVRELLESKSSLYNHPDFIEDDPISIPHCFTRKEDIEISGFFAALLAWGGRAVIIRNANRLMDLMDRAPFDFVTGYSRGDLNQLNSFVHRTFKGTDCVLFVRALRRIYLKHGGMEQVFADGFHDANDPAPALHHFRTTFFGIPHLQRSEKHVGDPYRHSACKRMCMFLRWMVRDDNRGVDFGLWKQIRPSRLAIPLDVHTARTARLLGLLNRKSNDWKAVMELTVSLRTLDPHDPARYDFALFGMGVNEGFGKP